MTAPRTLSASLTLALALGCSSGSDPESDISTGGERTEDTVDLEWGHPVYEDLRVGGQPDSADLEAAAAAGYTTVISLRTDAEQGTEGEQATVERLGMRFVRIPIAGPEDLTVANAEALDAALDAAAGPSMLHCGSGNRAGSLLGLRAYVTEGATGDEAMALARDAGMTRLADALEAAIRELCVDEPARCPGAETEVDTDDLALEGRVE